MFRMYLPSPSLTPLSASLQTFVWSSFATITPGKKRPSATPFLESRVDSLPPQPRTASIEQPCEPTPSILRQCLAQKNALLKAQNSEILNLKLDISDLFLTNAKLVQQKRELRWHTKDLKAEVVSSQKDIKHLAKQTLKEMTTKDKLYGQLVHAIEIIRVLEKREEKLEVENMEVLFVNDKLEKARRDDAVELAGWKGRCKRDWFEESEREMEILHRVEALEYELSVRRKGEGGKEGEAMASLRLLVGCEVDRFGEVLGRK